MKDGRRKDEGNQEKAKDEGLRTAPNGEFDGFEKNVNTKS